MGALVCDKGAPVTLTPGEKLTCSGSHAVTQADLDAGTFENTASAAGIGPANQAVNAQPAKVAVIAAQAPHLTLTKEADRTSYSQVGDIINYTLMATNDGNVTLTGVEISDAQVGALVCDNGVPVTLTPGGMLMCSGSHAVTQADLDAGSHQNTATTSGTDPKGRVVSNQASKSVPAAWTPHLTLTKGTDRTGLRQVGDIINYMLVAMNDSNVTLTDVAVSDGELGTLTCDQGAPVTLAPGAQLTCNGSHVVTQGDLDAGSYQNSATAAGIDPANQPVSALPAERDGHCGASAGSGAGQDRPDDELRGRGCCDYVQLQSQEYG